MQKIFLIYTHILDKEKRGGLINKATSRNYFTNNLSLKEQKL